MDRVRSLTCCCCGGSTTGRQFFNQDIGYGLCSKCADWIEGRGQTDMQRTYGTRGVHYAIDDHPSEGANP